MYIIQIRNITAIVFEYFISPSSAIFADLKILNAGDLFQLKQLRFVYQYVNETAPN